MTKIALTVLCIAGMARTGLAAKGQVRHRFLVASPGSRKVFRVSEDGSIEWSAPASSARDIWRMPNGNTLYSTKSAVVEVDSAGRKVWEYVGVPRSELHACQPLDNGDVLVAECGPCRLIEVGRDGKIRKEIRVKTTAGTHMQMRGVRKAKDGTYWIVFSGERVVRQVDDAGKVLRTVKPDGINFDHVHGITCLDNGNVLIGTGKGAMFIEVDRRGKVVWRIENDDLPGIKMGYTGGAQRLSNGNTICCMHSGSVAMFEVTPEKKVVWTYKSREVRGAIAVMVLDAGELEKGVSLQK